MPMEEKDASGGDLTGATAEETDGRLSLAAFAALCERTTKPDKKITKPDHPVAYPTHPVHPGPRGTDVRFASGLVAVVLGCVSVVIPLSSLSSQSGSGSWLLGVSRRIVCSQSTSRSKSGSLSVVLGHTPQNQNQNQNQNQGKDTRAGAGGGAGDRDTGRGS